MGKDDWKVGLTRTLTHARTFAHSLTSIGIIRLLLLAELRQSTRFKGDGRGGGGELRSNRRAIRRLNFTVFCEGAKEKKTKKQYDLNDSDDSLCSDSSGWILVSNWEKGFVSFCVEGEQKKRNLRIKLSLFHV